MLKSRLFSIIALALTLACIILLSTTAVSSSAGSRNPIQFLTGAASGDPLDIALDYLYGHVDSLGLQSSDLAGIVVTDRYTSSKSGITHIYFQQRYAGIGVYNALINVNVAADGSVISVGNRFVADLAKAVNTTNPVLSPAEAVRSAAASLGLALSSPLSARGVETGAESGLLLSDGGISLEPIPVKLMYQPLGSGAVRLAWDLSIYELDAQNYWSMRIDALTGRELDRANLVDHDNFGPPENAGVKAFAPGMDTMRSESSLLLTGEQYRVFAEPAESPNHTVDRTLVVDRADASASPFGWHDTNGAAGAEYTYTRGNNVYAYEDGNNPGYSPDGGAALSFDFTLDLSQQPDSYEAAAVTNLFYWNNLVHDVFYQYGFDEAAGNFQENNYGRGGASSDSVNAEAQDGGGLNNANFATPADGSKPRMQMYLWNTTTPMRDGDLDNGIIAHEYGHGISNRLTGGPGNVFCLENTEQPGEGWSDWIALIMTIEAGDTGADQRGIGTYALGQPPDTGTGIRAYPYSTDMAIDPRTYDAIKTAAVPHGVGSTWAAMLWEVTWGLIDQYGFDPDLLHGVGGNNMALQLVVDGMKLQPCSPGFVDARDAILQADLNNYGGANQCLIWKAFAKRGLGYSADQGSSSSRSDGVEAFDLPPECQQVLKITKTANPSPVDAGANLTYSLLVENDTVRTLTGVTVTDNVPADTTYVPGSANCGGSESGGVVTFPLGVMAAGESRTCSFQVTVSSALGTVTFLSDDMESGSGNWTATHAGANFDWTLGTTNPHSPSHAWFADDIGLVGDQYLAMTNPVTLIGQPTLSFWHHYNTEANYDGGVVEISAGGGAWTDLGSLMTKNGYNSTLSTGYSNPIGGRQAFSGDSGVYQETIVDLSSYAGSSVRIRFRLGTDSSIGDVGWYVDDISIADEDTLTNTACVSANEVDTACDTVVTLVNPSAGGPPDITVNPASLSAIQAPDQITLETLTIGNTGQVNLNWTIAESSDNCATSADLPWLNASPAGGVTAPFGSDDVTVSFDSAGLSAGGYTGSLCVNSDDPDESLVVISAMLTVEETPAFVDQYATADLPDAGTVSGDYTATHDDDGVAQTITERQSGGKPASRYDFLGHAWTFQLAAGSAQTFYVNAWQGNAGDLDDFIFAYSTDGANFADMVTVTATADGSPAQSYALPANLSGTVYVRVYDSDQTAGNLNFDTVNVDHIYIRTDDPGQPPPTIAMHVHAMTGVPAAEPHSRWSATATVTIHDGGNPDVNPVEGALVTGTWSGAATGDGSCITGADGSCSVTRGNIKYDRGPATFTITGVARGNDTYDAAANDLDYIDITQP